MALFAAHLRVLPFQFERRKVVVKFGRRPAVHRVTGSAVAPKTAFMRLIARMTGKTILRRGGKILQAARIHMTLDAFHRRVFSLQAEGKCVVVEICYQPVAAVMTIQTCRTK